MLTRRNFAFPPSTSFVRLPNLPYPYGVALSNAVLWEQVHPNYHLEGVDSIKHLQAIAKNASWPGRFVGLTNFVLGRAVSYVFSKAFAKLGWVVPLKVEHDFDFLVTAFSLLMNHLSEETQRVFLQQIMDAIDDDRNKQQHLVEQADRVNARINDLMLERSQLCHTIQENRLRFLAYEKGDPARLGIKSAVV
jgi:hypothetical protein